MEYNLAIQDAKIREKVNVDLMASAVAFKERYNMPVSTEQMAQNQPELLRDYFHQRVKFYRQVSLNFSCLPYKLHK
ncbi:MAG: DNA polymerase III subunit theta [Sodalis sp. Psp]|nr:DNA polymerase III subunit theta [Sodalis sp. Psp]MCR3756986.1 DNA polymerase III subunit theta [Sodalis sp. Ppy]